MHIEPLLVSEMLVFAKVVELRSFAAAARQLNLTTSAVSRSVGRLEAHWGVRLLHRTTRSLSLTELGAEVYAGCTQLAATARDVHATAGHYSDTPRGTVRLTAPTVFGEIWLTAQLPALRRRWPEVQLHIALSDQPEDLIAQGLDLAIRIARPEQLPPHMVARALRPVRYIAVATPQYLQGLGGALTHPAQLPERGAQCIALGYGTFQNQLQWQPRDGTGGPLISTSLPAPLTVASSLGITTLALQHQGIGLVADFCAHQLLEQGQLVQLLPDWELTGGYAQRTAYALYMPSRHVPLKVRALIDHLVEAGK
ncbi:LysR substrate-binding domain-containing protein [Comamonas sp.]|uniref:LysR family transcriptional regulator n=1 Tax=Comamonas sp. TaxID=34028 RepID=UPI003A93CBAD